MHSVELYELAIRVAESLGYNVRHENLGGVGGGACEVAGRKCIFVDLTLSPHDQLDQVAEALGQDPAIYVVDIPTEIRELVGIGRAA